MEIHRRTIQVILDFVLGEGSKGSYPHLEKVLFRYSKVSSMQRAAVAQQQI